MKPAMQSPSHSSDRAGITRFPHGRNILVGGFGLIAALWVVLAVLLTHEPDPQGGAIAESADFWMFSVLGICAGSIALVSLWGLLRRQAVEFDGEAGLVRASTRTFFWWRETTLALVPEGQLEVEVVQVTGTSGTIAFEELRYRSPRGVLPLYRFYERKDALAYQRDLEWVMQDALSATGLVTPR